MQSLPSGLLIGLSIFFDGKKVYSTVDFASWVTEDANVPSQCTGLYEEMRWFDYLVHGNGVWVGICVDISAYPKEYASIYVSQTPNGGWKKVFNYLSDNPEHSIAFNNGVFVYQLLGYVYTSTDGSNWIIPNKDFFPWEKSQLYELGNWILMVLQDNNNIYSITKDGNHWLNISIPVPNPTLQYNDAATLYFAYGLDGRVATSHDGLTWVLNEGFSIPGQELVMSIAYNGKLWVAVDAKAGIFIGK